MVLSPRTAITGLIGSIYSNSILEKCELLATLTTGNPPSACAFASRGWPNASASACAARAVDKIAAQTGLVYGTYSELVAADRVRHLVGVDRVTEGGGRSEGAIGNDATADDRPQPVWPPALNRKPGRGVQRTRVLRFVPTLRSGLLLVALDASLRPGGAQRRSGRPDSGRSARRLLGKSICWPSI
jgi:hypothetical protein